MVPAQNCAEVALQGKDLADFQCPTCPAYPGVRGLQLSQFPRPGVPAYRRLWYRGLCGARIRGMCERSSLTTPHKLRPEARLRKSLRHWQVVQPWENRRPRP